MINSAHSQLCEALAFSIVFFMVAGAGAVRGEAIANSVEPGQCFEHWSQAAEFVRKEGIQSLEEVTRRDERFANVRIVKAMLCRNDDGYAYQFVVQDRSGGLRRFKVETGLK